MSVVLVGTSYFSGKASSQQQESAPAMPSSPMASPASERLGSSRPEGIAEASLPHRELVIEVGQLVFPSEVDPSGGMRQFTPEEPTIVDYVRSDRIELAHQRQTGEEEPTIGGQVVSGPEVGQVEGEIYTWLDGNRTQEVRLQSDLVVTSDGDITSKDQSATDSSRIDSHSTVDPAEAREVSEGYPVFRSQAGTLMTLPGGVIVVLDAEWTTKQVDAFLTANGISTERVSELGWLSNGFFIDTDPGFASLNLANELAVEAGVELSSPNWWMEHTTR